MSIFTVFCVLVTAPRMFMKGEKRKWPGPAVTQRNPKTTQKGGESAQTPRKPTQKMTEQGMEKVPTSRPDSNRLKVKKLQRRAPHKTWGYYE